jgi:SAM-dependent methyltransferase
MAAPDFEDSSERAPNVNADQIAYWNGDAGTRWAQHQARIDAMLAEVAHAALDHAAPVAGEKVVDIGCGYGTTVLELAQRVGPQGRVIGIDVSKPMLDVAAERVRERSLDNVSLVLADASTHRLEEHTADLAFSRFGVMFFSEPVQAFAHIRTWLRPRGRVVFACWRPFADNPCFRVAYEAAKPFLPPAPPPDPNAPGPFAFADADRVRDILQTAGFSQIDLVSHETVASLAGPGELDSAAEFSARIGPAARALADVAPAAREAAKAAIREALKEHDRPDGIKLPGSIWLVAARA